MVAGGILFLLVSFDPLREHEYMVKATGRGGIGAVPIGTPLLAGPGAITAVMMIITIMGSFSYFSYFIRYIIRYHCHQVDIGTVGADVSDNGH